MDDDFKAMFDGDDDLDSVVGKDAEELEKEGQGDDKQPDAPADDAPKEGEDEPAKPTETPKEGEAPAEGQPEAPKPDTPDAPTSPEKVEEEPAPAAPLGKDDLRSIIQEIRDEDRNSSQAVERMESEILKAYHPEGLTDDIVDRATGMVLNTPADVVRASELQAQRTGGEPMTTEEAAQWLLNQQFQRKKENDEIRRSAREIAELNVNFERGGKAVLQKYEPLFREYPFLQEKVYKAYMALVKYDADKGVILSAPDIEEFYDTMLEYPRMAYEFKQNKPATAPVPAAAPSAGEPAKPAEPPKPSTDDRLDISGDGGAGGGKPDADPNDPNESLNDLFKE